VLLTGLTGASHLWDFPRVNYLTRVSLGLGAAGQFLVCLELFSFRAGCVLGVFLLMGLEKSLRISGRLVVWLL
jgi:hypothetical protein